MKEKDTIKNYCSISLSLINHYFIIFKYNNFFDILEKNKQQSD